MPEPLTLFEIELAPPIPVEEFEQAQREGDKIRHAIADAVDAKVAELAMPEQSSTLAAVTRRDLQLRAAERRNRMRPRNLVKLACERCDWRTKAYPADAPAACPGCAQTGCIVVTGWVSR